MPFRSLCAIDFTVVIYCSIAAVVFQANEAACGYLIVV